MSDRAADFGGALPLPKTKTLFIHEYPKSATLRLPGSEGGVARAEWIVRRLGRQAQDLDLVFLVHSRQEPSQLSNWASDHGCRTFICDSSSLGGAVFEAASKFGLDHVALADQHLAIAPCQLLETLYERHIASGSWYSETRGLPRSVDLVVLSSRLLECLPVERIWNIGDLKKVAPLVINECRKASEGPYSTARMSYLDVSTVYETTGQSRPECVEWSSYSGCNRLKSLMAEDPTGTLDSGRLLSLWKKGALDDSRRPPLELFQILGPPPGARKVRVLFVSNNSAYAGAQDALVSVAASLDSSLFDLHALIALDGMFADRLNQAKVTVHVVGEDFSVPTFRSFASCHALLKYVKPHLIHVNGDSGLPIACAAAANGIPVLHHLRLAEWDLASDVQTASVRIIAVSEFVRTKLLRDRDVSPSQVKVIYDGVDLERFSPAAFDRKACRARLGIRPDSQVVLMVARYARTKRQDLLIEAFSAAAAGNPSQRDLVFVGESHGELDWEAHIRRLASGIARPETVHFLGFEHDVRWLYCAADVVSLCSEQEALSQCVLEAMAMGLPVLVSDSGGAAELIIDGKNGFVVRNGDVIHLQQKLEVLLTDGDLRGAMGRAGRQRCQELFTARQSAHSLQNLFEEVIGEQYPIKRW